MAIRDILVTGGAGYIGSHLVDALVGRDYRVTVLDNLEPQVHRSGTWPSYANPKAEYVKGDVRDRSVFEPLVLRSQAVVHFGAAVSVGQSMWAPQIPLAEALQTEARHFIECIDQQQTPTTDGHAGLRVVRLLEAATLSMTRHGALVPLDATSAVL